MTRNRGSWLAVLAALSFLQAAPAAADQLSCRKKAASNAAAMYNIAAKQFLKCSGGVADGKPCSTTFRDALVQNKLTATQIKVLRACEDPVGTQFGFLSDDALSLRVAGIATAEGRQVVDAVYGRNGGTASTISTATGRKCAKLIAKQISSAGKKFIKLRMACGATCSGAVTAKANDAFTKAQSKIQNKCLASDLDELIGNVDPTNYVNLMKTNATRVVNALTPGSNPSANVVSPAAGTTITPSGLPLSLATSVGVANAPHAGYVVSVKTGTGIATGFNTYDPNTNRFDRDITISFLANANYNLPVQLRTYLGVFNAASTVKFNLGNVAPDVVINSPATGTITNSSSVTVSGQVIGDLSKASVLLINGVPASFNPTTGAFSTSTPLSNDSVQIVQASVQAFSLGTENTDSVVVLKGSAVGMGTRLNNANANRFNNSGFNAIKGALVAPLTTGLAGQIQGQQFNGGTISEFSMGTPTTQLGAVGANTVQIVVGLPNFRIRATGIDSGILGITCNLTLTASLVQITYQANLEPAPPGPGCPTGGCGMTTIPINTSLQLFNSNPSLDGGFLGICSLGGLVVDINGLIQDGFEDGIAGQLPAQINAALGAIDIAGPIGGAIGVEIDALYQSIPEDSNGVTFNVASNVINNSPVPGAPNITQTLNPAPGGAPVFNQTVPGSSTSYDLAFCLSEGFINRFMAALMLAGQFNQSINEIPPPGGGDPIPVNTEALSFLFADPSYNTACPNCPVTISVAPSVAAVSRAPKTGENADIVLVVPNYRMTAVADNAGSPMPLIAADVTFSVGLLLGADGATISPTVGDPAVLNFKVVSNSIGADESALANGVIGLFSQFASGLAGLFTQISLPPFELAPGQAANIYALGSGWNVSCASLYLGFTPPPTRTFTSTPTRTRTATITPTPTITPPVPNTATFTPSLTPTKTQTPTVTPGGSPAIGQHTMVLASGSAATLQTGTLALPIPVSGSLIVQIGAPNNQGVAPIVIPKAGAVFNPVSLFGQDACISAADDGIGIVDCDGGTANRDVASRLDHNTTPGNAGNGGSGLGFPDDPECDDTRTLPNGAISTACMEGDDCRPDGFHPGVCNSPTEVIESGIMGAGDMRVIQPISIRVAPPSDRGPDGLPCTADDIITTAGVTQVFLTTGTASGRIFDAGNVAGAEMGPGKLCGAVGCQAQLTGVPLSCNTLRTEGKWGGARIVGAFVATDAPTINSDIITALQLRAPNP